MRAWLLALVLAVLLVDISQPALANEEDAYADGYEYTYEYEGETESEDAEVTVDGALSTSKTANAATASKPAAVTAEPTATQIREEEEAALERRVREAERAFEAQQEAERREIEQIRRRNAGKKGYKKSVGGGVVGKITKMLSDRVVAVLQMELTCEPNAAWGTPINVSEDKKTVKDDKSSPASEDDTAIAAAATTAAKEAEEAVDSRGKKKKPKKPTFRELQAAKAAEKEAKEKLKKSRDGHYLSGASCENLLCSACRIVVAEFADVVVQGGRNEKVEFIDDLLGGFCHRRELVMRYHDYVPKMCMEISASSETGYRDTLLLPFEKDVNNWEQANQPQSLVQKQGEVCMALGACEASQLDIQMTPKNKQQEHWDDKCYTCQAFARDLEERLHLSKGLTENSVGSVVRSTCDRVSWPVSSFKRECAPLVEGAMLEDISWIAFMHSEVLQRRGKVDKRFGDSLCESIGFCTKWVDPDVEEEVVMEEVFF